MSLNSVPHSDPNSTQHSVLQQVGRVHSARALHAHGACNCAHTERAVGRTTPMSWVHTGAVTESWACAAPRVCWAPTLLSLTRHQAAQTMSRHLKWCRDTISNRARSQPQNRVMTPFQPKQDKPGHDLKTRSRHHLQQARSRP